MGWGTLVPFKRYMIFQPSNGSLGSNGPICFAEVSKFPKDISFIRWATAYSKALLLLQR